MGDIGSGGPPFLQGGVEGRYSWEVGYIMVALLP